LQGEFALPHIDRQEGGRQNIENRGYRVVSIFSRKDLTDLLAAQRSDITVA
jgi:orotate phosphoribosyltransferase